MRVERSSSRTARRLWIVVALAFVIVDTTCVGALVVKQRGAARLEAARAQIRERNEPLLARAITFDGFDAGPSSSPRRIEIADPQQNAIAVASLVSNCAPSAAGSRQKILQMRAEGRRARRRIVQSRLGIAAGVESVHTSGAGRRDARHARADENGSRFRAPASSGGESAGRGGWKSLPSLNFEAWVSRFSRLARA
ncbi:MAG: hypothetical protein SGI72_15700 [Planctomycetota bacterium]|nr:hypothetical protein [Planctomycetota bacterium]